MSTARRSLNYLIKENADHYTSPSFQISLAGRYSGWPTEVMLRTPFLTPGMTAGRGWIAPALVMFVGGPAAFLPGAAGRRRLHPPTPCPGHGPVGAAQLMSALPYLSTVAVLIEISRRGRKGPAAPASLGARSSRTGDGW
jgi:ABC-type uncharacterized transport system permease subunit